MGRRQQVMVQTKVFVQAVLQVYDVCPPKNVEFANWSVTIMKDALLHLLRRFAMAIKMIQQQLQKLMQVTKLHNVLDVKKMVSL